MDRNKVSEKTWPAWLTVGSAVVEVQTQSGQSVLITTVERFTKTQCVLHNGKRYKIKDVRGEIPMRKTYGACDLDRHLRPVQGEDQ